MLTQKLTQEEKDQQRLDFYRKEFHRTRNEEWANGITHMVGAVFGVVALSLMMAFAAFKGNAWHITSCAIYGATLILLNFSSTMYHLVHGYRAKRVWQLFDHCSIYILIAGTYTPFVLVPLRGSCGWPIFYAVWSLAFVGILVELILSPRWAERISLPIFIIQGWLIITAVEALFHSMPLPGTILLVTGGVVYTLGIFFFVLDHIPYMHTIWHLFVLAGNVCHWVSIAFYIIPWN